MDAERKQEIKRAALCFTTASLKPDRAEYDKLDHIIKQIEDGAVLDDHQQEILEASLNKMLNDLDIANDFCDSKERYDRCVEPFQRYTADEVEVVLNSTIGDRIDRERREDILLTALSYSKACKDGKVEACVLAKAEIYTEEQQRIVESSLANLAENLDHANAIRALGRLGSPITRDEIKTVLNIVIGKSMIGKSNPKMNEHQRIIWETVGGQILNNRETGEAINSILNNDEKQQDRLEVVEYVAGLTDDEVSHHMTRLERTYEPKHQRRWLIDGLCSGLKQLPTPVEIKPKDYDGSKCPVCKSDEIDAGATTGIVESDATYPLNREANCANCGSTWMEEMEFCGYHDLETPDPKERWKQ
jgi:predicted Zn-ribbon and HTH transcriptional regulator